MSSQPGQVVPEQSILVEEDIDIGTSSQKKRKLDKPVNATDLYLPTSRKTSSIWKVFRLIKTEPCVAWCTLCERRFQVSLSAERVGSSNLLKHIRRMHSAVLEERSATTAENSIQKMFAAQKPSRSFQCRLHKWLAKAFFENDWSFQSIENESFRKFISLLSQGKFAMCRRAGLVSYQTKLYGEVVETLKKSCETISDFSFTTDVATLANKQQYVTVTAHYIDQEWNLKHMVMAVLFASDSQTQVYIRDLLLSVIQQRSLQKKVHYIVSDNGSNFLSAMGLLCATETIEENLRCFCHTLHLAVTRSLKEPKVAAALQCCRAIAELRSRSSMFAQQLLRQQKARINNNFNAATNNHNCENMQVYEIVEDKHLADEELEHMAEPSNYDVQLLQSAEDLSFSSLNQQSDGAIADDEKDLEEATDATKINQPMNEVGDNEENNTVPQAVELIADQRYALTNDCMTRWSSTLLMISRMYTWREEINLTLDQMNMSPKRLDPTTVSILRDLISLLQPFADVTTVLQAATVPTLGMAYWAQHKLGQHLQQVHASDVCEEVKATTHVLMTQLVNQWKQPSKCISLAVVLDPRFKTFEWAVDADNTAATNYFFSALRVAYVTEKGANNPLSSVNVNTTTAAQHGENDAHAMALKRLGINEDETVVSELDEIVRYKHVRKISITSNPLEWWKSNESNFPILSKLAKRYLCVPASSAESERFFSNASQIVTTNFTRNRLTSAQICQLIFMKHNKHLLQDLSN